MAIAAFLLCSVVLHVAWSHSDVCPAPPAAGVSYRFIISVPAGCTPYTSTCTFFAALRTNDNSSSWLGYYMEGVATGYLALGWNNVSQMSLLIQFTELIPNITIFVDHALDVSQSMSDIIACAYNNQTKVVQVVDTWVDAINVVVTDANTAYLCNQSAGTYGGGRMSCIVVGVNNTLNFTSPFNLTVTTYTINPRWYPSTAARHHCLNCGHKAVVITQCSSSSCGVTLHYMPTGDLIRDVTFNTASIGPQ
ncbi:hypothetical protein EMCRGX_G003105 [Ephydatia muelleri]|eukprot:Em0001g2842a